MEDTEMNSDELDDENQEIDVDFENQEDFEDSHDDEYINSGSNDDWDDQRTWGQKRGFCDLADNCYGCSYADQCF